MSLFVDGQLKETYTTGSIRGARTLRLGGMKTSGVRSAALYDRLLSSAQIARLFERRSGRADRRGRAVARAASGLLPPTNSALPTVSGTARDGSTLTSTTGTWSAVGPISYTRQWTRCDAAGANCADIAAATATAQTYVLAPSDVGHSIRVRVMASALLGANDATSAQTAVVAALVPANMTAPTITGTARDGQSLSSTTGTWSGTPPLSFVRQWRRCDSAGNACVDIASATGGALALTPADVGNTIRVNVTASNGGGSTQTASVGTAVVAAAPPANSALPVISGTAQEGRDLAVTEGAWTGTPTLSYAYQWQRCAPAGSCSAISGATDPTYTLTAGDVAKTVTAQVTASNAGGQQSATAQATASVAESKPFVRSAPQISGSARDGQQLTVSSGQWGGSAPIGYAYAWQRCSASGDACAAISGATDAAYIATGPDIDRRLRVQVTASNHVGSTSSNTDASDVVAADPPQNTATPTITGSPVDGETLQVQRGTWTGSDPITYGYQWRRCTTTGDACSDIQDATSDSYDATADDVDHAIRVQITATNAAGTQTATSPPRTVSARPPTVADAPTVTGPARQGSDLTAARGSWDGTAPLTYAYQWQRCISGGTGCQAIPGADQLTYRVVGEDVATTLQIKVTATNAAGSADATSTVTDVVTAAPPANDAPPAPPLSQTERSSFTESTKFLYSGPDAVQSGVDADTIVERRAAVLRGRVSDRAGQPVTGVSITVIDHPEYGQTTTQRDGSLYMAVNGGGPLTVRYEKAGYLPVERQDDVALRDYSWLQDVVLTRLDPAANAIDLGTPLAPAQIAQGSPVSDEDGQRQATLLFKPATQATMKLPDGAIRPLPQLTVRATEYTVGDAGPAAMPGPLPATSAYTYAAEFSVDEATAAGATDVSFSRPVINYTENFVGFPVGMRVPTGYYDRERHAWVPSRDGRIVKILAEQDGLARLDVSGSGAAASATELEALGIDDVEREQLAQLYDPGTSLWRVAIDHFTPWDHNWPLFGPPPGAVPPQVALDPVGPIDDPCEGKGSIIECETQTLGEQLPIAGTDSSLAYRSDRVAGRGVNRKLELQLTPASIPAGLERVVVDIAIAGRRVREEFVGQPDLSYTFAWDGKDAFGREVIGAVPVGVAIFYEYPVTRYADPGQWTASFASFSGTPTSIASRERFISSQGLNTTLTYRAGPKPSQDLGGWSFSEHHRYDPVAGVLQLGSGERRSARGLGRRLDSIAGRGGDGPSEGDGGPATQAVFDFPQGVAEGPDGSLYFTDSDNFRVRKISPDGIITTVVGTGQSRPDSGDPTGGDGGPATEATIDFSYGLDVAPDGSLLIADYDRVRRVDPSGVISTVAGGNGSGYSGDDGPATDATFDTIDAIAGAPDGSFYVIDYYNNRVRQVGTDGIIRTVAGSGPTGFGGGGFAGDGGPATQARLERPEGLDVAHDGSLLIADAGNSRVRSVSPDGIIRTVAGAASVFVARGDGGAATEARLLEPVNVAAQIDGSIIIADIRDSAVRRVSPDGIITTLASDRGCGGERVSGATATGGCLIGPIALAVTHDDAIVVVDLYDGQIKRIAPAVPSYADEEIAIASIDGQELYVFDARGRHLRTTDAKTLAVRWTFAYDSAGRLVSARDGDGETTTIQRDPSGAPQAILAPRGQRTTLGLDANGYLNTVTDPAGQSTRAQYTSLGLLTSLTDPRQNTTTFAYDTRGRLTKDTNPEGGYTQLDLSGSDGDMQVRSTSAEGRSALVRTQRLSDDTLRRTSTDTGGHQSARRFSGPDVEELQPDGTLLRGTNGPDARFGLLAPFATSATLSTPAGRTLNMRQTRLSTIDPDDPVKLLSETTEQTTNDRTIRTTFDRAGLSFTTTTPAGRQYATVIDDQRRPTRQTSPAVEPIESTYDDTGRLTGVAQDARRSQLAYDTGGRLQSITDALGRQTTYDRDAVGRVTNTTLPGARSIEFAYDPVGNLTSIAPSGGSTHRFVYDNADRLTEVRGADGGDGVPVTSYDLTLDGQVGSITRPDDSVVDLDYDSAGRLSRLASPTNETTYEYATADGQPRKITDSQHGSITTSHDGPLPLRDEVQGAVSGSVERTFNDDLRVAATTVNDTAPVASTYDDDGLLSGAGDLTLSRASDSGQLTATTLDEVHTSHAYNPFGELDSWTATGPAGASLWSATLTRDKLGRTTSRSQSTGAGSGSVQYDYDDAGRLSEVRDGAQLIARYSYDAHGNRLSRSDPTSTTTAEYDARDRITRDGELTYRNNQLGERTEAKNTTTGQRTTYRYDGASKLTGVDLPDATTIRYRLDALGHRIATEQNGTLTQRLLYGQNDAPQAELDAAGQIRTRFVYATRDRVPDYMTRAGRNYRLLTDELGSVRLVVDTQTGLVAQRLDYDPDGQVTTDTNPGLQPFGYAGGLYDPSTGLVHFDAREYDPHTARFLTADPLGPFGGNTNPYTYAANDPINNVDPDGLSLLDTLKDAQSFISDTSAVTVNELTLGLANKIAGIDKLCVGGLSTVLGTIGGNLNPKGLIKNAAELGIRNAAKDVGKGVRFTGDQDALIQLAKDAKRRGGLTSEDADALKGWGDEYGVPVRGPEAHQNRPGFGSQPHYHVGPVGHIPQK